MARAASPTPGPEYLGLPGSGRLTIAAVANVSIIAGIGYATGCFNDRSLTCEDFTTAGG